MSLNININFFQNVRNNFIIDLHFMLILLLLKDETVLLESF